MAVTRSRASEPGAQRAAADAIDAMDQALEDEARKRQPAGKAQLAYVKDRLAIVPEALARVRNRTSGTLTEAERDDVLKAVIEGAPANIVPGLKAAVELMVDSYDEDGNLGAVREQLSFASITLAGELKDVPGGAGSDPNRSDESIESVVASIPRS